LIVTSSGIAHLPVPGAASYSSTKIFVSRLYEAIAGEPQAENIDLMAWEAGAINTKLNVAMKSPNNISCATAVKACFSMVGLETRTFGHWKHEVKMLPVFFVNLGLCGSFIEQKTRAFYEKLR
jgi:short-subunit dehydrogenase